MYEERKVRDLPEKSQIELTDHMVIEDLDGTKLGLVSSLRNLMMDNLVFDSVEMMKAANVVAGDYCITLGYHTPGDGGAALYKIVYEPTAVEDGANWHYLYKSDVNRAKYITFDGTVTPQQFGAYGDGVRDDRAIIEKCLKSKYKTQFAQGSTYRITSPLSVSYANNIGCNIDLNGCTIAPDSCNVFTLGETAQNIRIYNGNINMANAQTYKMFVENTDQINADVTFEDLYVYGGYGTVIDIKGAKSFHVDNCVFESTKVSTIAINIDITKAPSSKQHYIVSNTKLYNYARAFSINSAAISAGGSVLIDNCALINLTSNSSTIFLYNGRSTSGEANLRNISISNIYTEYVKQLCNNSGGDIVSIKDICMMNGETLISTGMTSSAVTIDGNIIMNGGNVSPKTPIFGTMTGLLIIGNVFVYNSSRYEEKSTNGAYSCTLYDKIGPHGRPIVDIATASSLDPNCYMRNLIYRLTGTGINITNINIGVEGQTIGLKFKNAGTITNSGTITLDTSPKSVAKGGMVWLKCMSGKWVEI